MLADALTRGRFLRDPVGILSVVESVAVELSGTTWERMRSGLQARTVVRVWLSAVQRVGAGRGGNGGLSSESNGERIMTTV